MKLAVALLVASLAVSSGQDLVPSGGMVPGGGGGGGGRRFGGYVRVSQPMVGFWVAGSSLPELNGCYGPRLQDDLVPDHFPSLAQDVDYGIYKGDGGWSLAHLRALGGSETEWVFLDEALRERFVHVGDTLIPGTGKRWSRVDRQPRSNGAPAGGAAGGGDAAGGEGDGGDAAGGGGSSGVGTGAGGSAWHGGSQLRAITEQDLEAQLPWQLIGVRDYGMLEGLRRNGRAHSEAAAAAAYRLSLPRGPADWSAHPAEQQQEPPAGMVVAESVEASLSEAEAAAAAGDTDGVAAAVSRATASLPQGQAASWAEAAVMLRCGAALRRCRLHATAEELLTRALAAYPAYKAALFERGLLLIDSQKPDQAANSFEALLRLDREWAQLAEWLVFAQAQATRATHRMRTAEQEEQARRARERDEIPPACYRVAVGTSLNRTKTVYGFTPPTGSRCPRLVSSENWLGGHRYEDQFDVVQEEAGISVTRRDRDEGWGLDLAFICCSLGPDDPPDADLSDLVRRRLERAAATTAETAAATAVAARWRSDDHYEVLGLSCDFSLEEIKRTYRSLSLRVHPDRPGGSAEAFARVAGAHECLSSEACRRGFDRGEGLQWARARGGEAATFYEAVERHFFAERYPFEPFGDPYDLHPEMQQRRREERQRRVSSSARDEMRPKDEL